VDYQLIAGLIAKNKIGAWEASDRRTFLRIVPEGQAGAWGFYDPDTNDIYIVSGLSPINRQCVFVDQAMHAIRDFRNLPETLAKYIAADGYIGQAFVALALRAPPTSPDGPEDVAFRGAAKLLQTPLRSRDAAWTRKFREAYDELVEAVEALGGTKDADEIVDMLEDQQEQDAEKALVKVLVQSLNLGPILAGE
jgi:hypothetical protein